MGHADSQLRINLYMIAGTIFLHGTMMVLNELFFRRAEFLQGIGWIYIPAGTRLLCTLLFGWAGAVGLLITGWFACYWYYFPGDALRATAGTIAGALGPYLVYLIARREYGLLASLKNLTRSACWRARPPAPSPVRRCTTSGSCCTTSATRCPDSS